MATSRASRLGWIAGVLLGQRHWWAFGQSEQFLNSLVDDPSRARKKIHDNNVENERVTRYTTAVAFCQRNNGDSLAYVGA